MPPHRMLRLATNTDPIAYARAALADVSALLVDHAHCEHKAAVTALSFVSKYPDDPVLVKTLAGLARDEAAHFARVVDLCAARGIELSHPEPDVYVKRLLTLVRPGVLAQRVDRLLACAFIEARACERLQILAHAFVGTDDELAELYGDLWQEEARHHALFVDLALRSLVRAGGDVDGLQERVDEFARHEAAIVSSLPIRAAIH